MNKATLLAVCAALFTVSIWANFLVTTGGMTSGGLGVVELGFIRATVCGIALWPIVHRIGYYPKGMELWRFAVLVIGAGSGFLFLIPLGFAYAPPADSGIFAPGTLPLWAAITSMVFLGERISAIRGIGFFLIAIGVLGAGGLDAILNAGDGVWIGYIFFASGSLMFSFYAAAQRNSGLDALEATALVNFWTLPAACVMAFGFDLDFSSVSMLAIGWTALAQFGSGVVAIITFTYATMTLGPSRGAAFIALTPAIVALASDWFLGQPASDMIWIGAVVVSAGVLIASGLFERQKAAKAV